MASSTVVLIHPSRLFSEALGSLLNNPPFRITYIATDVDCVPLEALVESETSIFLVGGRSPERMSSAVSSIRRRLPAAIIVVIGDTIEPGAIMMALEAGANAYLREAMTAETLIMALELVLHEEVVLPPEMARYLPTFFAPSAEIIGSIAARPGFNPVVSDSSQSSRQNMR